MDHRPTFLSNAENTNYLCIIFSGGLCNFNVWLKKNFNISSTLQQYGNSKPINDTKALFFDSIWTKFKVPRPPKEACNLRRKIQFPRNQLTSPLGPAPNLLPPRVPVPLCTTTAAVYLHHKALHVFFARGLHSSSSSSLLLLSPIDQFLTYSQNFRLNANHFLLLLSQQQFGKKEQVVSAGSSFRNVRNALKIGQKLFRKRLQRHYGDNHKVVMDNKLVKFTLLFLHTALTALAQWSTYIIMTWKKSKKQRS